MPGAGKLQRSKKIQNPLTMMDVAGRQVYGRGHPFFAATPFTGRHCRSLSLPIDQPTSIYIVYYKHTLYGPSDCMKFAEDDLSHFIPKQQRP